MANHIVKYAEFPSVGPSTGYLPELKRSPIWYYFAAVLLLIQNNVLFLGWVNIFISLLTIVIVYLLARAMFNKSTALIATILFSFSQFSFQQAIFYIWEPFITQTLLLLNFLLFILAERKKSYPLLLVGILIFAIASAIYHSGFFVVPVIIALIFYILRRQGKRAVCFIGAFVILTATLLMIHLPVIIYHLNNNTNLSFLEARKGIISPLEFLSELYSLLYIFIGSYFLNLDKNLLSINNFLLTIIIGLLIYAFLNLKTDNKRRHYFIILSFILTPLVIITLIQLNRPFHDPQSMPIYGILRYFLASIVLFIILMADVINSVFSKFSLWPLKIFLILGLISIAFPSFTQYLDNISINLPKRWQASVPNLPAIDAIKESVYQLKQENHFNSFNFFQIDAFGRVGTTSFTIDLPSFWIILERDFNTKLVELDDKSSYTVKSIGDNQIIFLVCYNYSSILEEKVGCVDIFRKENANHLMIKPIYSQFPYSIYLTKRSI